MYVPSRICPICCEYEPHYCAAMVTVDTIKLPRSQGQWSSRWIVTVEIHDRMPPYEYVRSTRIITNRGGES